MIQRAIQFPSLPWSRYLHHRLRSCSGPWDLDIPSLFTSFIPPQQLLLTPFWKLALKDWQSLIPHQPVTVMTPDLMLAQPLFLNREIMIDGKVLTQSKWNHIYRKGLKTISHLWKNDHWRSVQEMRQDLNIRIKSKTLYMIRSAIPMNWRDHIWNIPPTPLSYLKLLL